MTFVESGRLCNTKASVSGISVTTGAARVVPEIFWAGSGGSTTNALPRESILTVSSSTAVDQAALDTPDDRCQPMVTEPDCDDTYSPRVGCRDPAEVGAELEKPEITPNASTNTVVETADWNGRIITSVPFDCGLH